jgi:hypothetical protein
MTPSGYSGTPLPKKLGIKEGHVVALLSEPDNLKSILVPMPIDVHFRTDLRSKPDVAVAFFEGDRVVVPVAMRAFGCSGGSTVGRTRLV